MLPDVPAMGQRWKDDPIWYFYEPDIVIPTEMWNYFLVCFCLNANDNEQKKVPPEAA